MVTDKNLNKKQVLVEPDNKLLIPTNKIKENIKEGDYHLAILYAADAIEKILFSRLEDYMDKELVELFGVERKGIGTYLDWCMKLDLVDKDKLNDVKEFIRYRNKIVHDYAFLYDSEGLTEDKIGSGMRKERKDKLDEVLEKAIYFIKNTPMLIGDND